MYDSVIIDTHHFAVVETYRTYNTMGELQCKLWSLGDNDISVYVNQLYQMYYSGGGY